MSYHRDNIIFTIAQAYLKDAYLKDAYLKDAYLTISVVKEHNCLLAFSSIATYLEEWTLQLQQYIDMNRYIKETI